MQTLATWAAVVAGSVWLCSLVAARPEIFPVVLALAERQRSDLFPVPGVRPAARSLPAPDREDLLVITVL